MYKCDLKEYDDFNNLLIDYLFYNRWLFFVMYLFFFVKLVDRGGL